MKPMWTTEKYLQYARLVNPDLAGNPVTKILTPLAVIKERRRSYRHIHEYIAALTEKYLDLAENKDIGLNDKKMLREEFYRYTKYELFSEVKMKKLIEAVENKYLFWHQIYINQLEDDAFKARVDAETIGKNDTLFKAMYDIEYFLPDDVYIVDRTPVYENVVPIGHPIKRQNWLIDEIKTILCLNSRSATRYNDDGTITEIY